MCGQIILYIFSLTNRGHTDICDSIMQTSIKTDGFRSLAEGEAVEFHVEVTMQTCTKPDGKMFARTWLKWRDEGLCIILYQGQHLPTSTS